MGSRVTNLLCPCCVEQLKLDFDTIYLHYSLILRYTSQSGSIFRGVREWYTYLILDSCKI